MTTVIDVSQWQGIIDWDTAKNYIDAAIIRCGWGSDYIGQDDSQYWRNVSECERLGIPYGIYLYSYANSVDQAISEAKHALRLVNGCNISLPIYFDSEESGTEYNASAKAMAFCNEITKAGYDAGVYASISWWNAYLQGVTGVSKWCAHWQTDSPGMDCDIWQYTSDGNVPGIVGRVDMNECYIEVNEMITESDMDRIAVKVWEYIYLRDTDNQDRTLESAGIDAESNGYNVLRQAFWKAYDANKRIEELEKKIDAIETSNTDCILSNLLKK